MNGVIVYLIGFAGSGKLTIAKAIQARYDCILVDNHSINNVIFALLDLDGQTPLPSKVWDNVLKVRSAVLDTIRHLAKPGRSFLFTNELLDGEERDRKAFLDIAKLARDRSALFLPVRLKISPDELARRVVSPGRAERFKETNPEVAWKKAQERDVFKPQGFKVLEIDITSLTAEETAETILLALTDRLSHAPTGF
jgi:chloramphenicol 3-O-phosphotransferase